MSGDEKKANVVDQTATKLEDATKYLEALRSALLKAEKLTEIRSLKASIELAVSKINRLRAAKLRQLVIGERE